MNINEFNKNQDVLQYGSVENKEKFFKGLAILEKKYFEFFKNAPDGENEIINYVKPNRPFAGSGKVFLGIEENSNIPSELKSEIIKLWESLF